MKKLVLKKGCKYLLIVINILIMMTLTNNSFLVDLILISIFIGNVIILERFGGLDE